MDLKDIDLNLLVVFNQLLIERRVSATAEALDLSQPAVSNALRRLRTLFGDELFLRTSRGMEPTPFATQMAESIGYALGAIHRTINDRAVFEPAESQRKFTIGMTDIGEIYFLPKLIDLLEKVAPAVSVSTVRNTAENLRTHLESGHVDLAIGLLPQLKTGFFQRRLFTQRYVCMFRKGHELEKGKLTLKRFSEAEHVVVVSPNTGHAKVDESLERKGIKRTVRLTVPHFVAVGHILHSSNLVATVPERYAQQCLEPFNLQYVPHPVALPEHGINVFWHAKFHKEPGNMWLRGVLVDLFAD